MLLAVTYQSVNILTSLDSSCSINSIFTGLVLLIDNVTHNDLPIGIFIDVIGWFLFDLHYIQWANALDRQCDSLYLTSRSIY